MGSIQVNNSEIFLFGGFNDGPLDSTLIYKCTDPKTEGTLHTSENGTSGSTLSLIKMAHKDFFMVNGVYIDTPSHVWEHTDQKERLFMGHTHIHCVNLVTKEMSEWPYEMPSISQ